MVQADPKGGSAANLGPSRLSEWAIGQVFFPSASLASHWLRERHDLWEGRDLRWWLAAAGGCGRGTSGSRGTESFLEGGSGLHISVFIIKSKLRLGAWSLVTLDVIVVPQAPHNLATPQISLLLSSMSKLKLRLGRDLPKVPQQATDRVAQPASAPFQKVSAQMLLLPASLADPQGCVRCSCMYAPHPDL